MYSLQIKSDQSYTWSDKNDKRAFCHPEKTSPGASAPVAPLKSILRGSLIERYKRCGKPGRKCAEGPGHGPRYYLSVSHPGLRPQMDYVPQESHARIAEFVANYHRAREILEAISEINRELLRRREAL
jgi:hypothetical protein